MLYFADLYCSTERIDSIEGSGSAWTTRSRYCPPISSARIASNVPRARRRSGSGSPHVVNSWSDQTR